MTCLLALSLLQISFAQSRGREKILQSLAFLPQLPQTFRKCFLWFNLCSVCYHVNQVQLNFPASHTLPHLLQLSFFSFLLSDFPPLFRASDPLSLHRIQDFKSYKSCQIIQCPHFTDVETKAQRESLTYHTANEWLRQDQHLVCFPFGSISSMTWDLGEQTSAQTLGEAVLPTLASWRLHTEGMGLLQGPFHALVLAPSCHFEETTESTGEVKLWGEIKNWGRVLRVTTTG